MINWPQTGNDKSLRPVFVCRREENDNYDSERKRYKKRYGFGDQTFFLISVSSYGNRTIVGTLYCRLFAPIVFQGLDQLLLLLDMIMDKSMDVQKQMSYPQAYYEKRSLKKAGSKKEELNLRHNTGDWDHMVSSVLQMPNSFSIKILYRQNSSMQGMICNKDDDFYFRSGLELVRYIYQVLESKNAQEI